MPNDPPRIKKPTKYLLPLTHLVRDNIDSFLFPNRFNLHPTHPGNQSYNITNSRKKKLG